MGRIILAPVMSHAHESEGSEGGEGGGTRLRIDRWLWCTRLYKSRTLAAEAVGGGKVHVNGRRVKPAHAVGVGDKVSISRTGFTFECEVLELPDRRDRCRARGARKARGERAPGFGVRATQPGTS
jgi:ribosomal 50S subunit-recycling heat shock protein